MQKPKFRVADKVYLLKSDGSAEGPYLVGSVVSSGKCTLSDLDGQSAKKGEEIDMARLQAA